MFVLGTLDGRCLSFCRGTIRVFDTYEEAKQLIRIAGFRLFVGRAEVKNDKLINKKIWWEDGIKNWHHAESLNEAFKNRRFS